MGKNWIENFEGIWREPKATARNWREKNKGKVIGWAIPDAPEELILAAGAFPLALLGEGIAFSGADAHFQGFACSYSRSLLELITRGELDFLDALIIPHTCDAMRAFDLVVKDLANIASVETYRPPRVKDNEASIRYLREEIERIRNHLGKITGRYPDTEDIRRASHTVNALKAGLKDLKKEMNSGRVTAMEFFSAVQAGMVGDKKEVSSLIKEFVSEAEKRAPSKKGTRIVLAGKVAEPVEIISEIESAGFHIVDDLLVNGSRYVESEVDLNKEPITALVEAQLNKIPIAGFYHRKESRSKRIIKRVKDSQAQAVIYLIQKFCEPYEMEVVGVEEDLKKAGIPVLRLETDYQQSSLAPLRTRIDAFYEMLSR